jgi:hypothetical protein
MREETGLETRHHLYEKFGENEFFFIYGDPFNQKNEIQPKMPTSYYENFLKPLKKYEVVVVAGREHFVAETRFGKVICPGSAGFQPIKGSKPHFAVIDTNTTDVAFFEFKFKKSDVEDKIRKENLPNEIRDLLYHGYL